MTLCLKRIHLYDKQMQMNFYKNFKVQTRYQPNIGTVQLSRDMILAYSRCTPPPYELTNDTNIFKTITLYSNPPLMIK